MSNLTNHWNQEPNLERWLQHLLQQGVELWVEEGKLRIRAPQGVLTTELRRQLTERKGELVARLQRSIQEHTPLPTVIPAPEARHEPFPLTDVQHAYWVGRGANMDLGGVATHGYLELDMSSLDLPRLEWAWRQLIQRHEMLRMIVRPDGLQQILPSVPEYCITVVDLRDEDESDQESRLQEIRATMSHQVLPTDQWPLFDLRATRIDAQTTRLHISIDILITDGMGLLILFKEWFQLYHKPDLYLEPLTLSFRDYLLAEQTVRETAIYEQSKAYWMARLDTLPPAPELPIVPDNNHPPQFHRHRFQLAEEQWQMLQARAKRAGITPSTLLLAAYAKTLATWSKTPHFTINLTLFNRQPMHEEVTKIIGDFTELILVEIDTAATPTFAQLARQVQQQLASDMDHRYFGAIRVLRERNKQQGGAGQALMPVVFTSTLVLNAAIEPQGIDDTQEDFFLGEEVYAISQTPQVWIDHQVMERDGTLIFNWDTVEGIFPAGMVEEMFAAYCALLQRLATEEATWHEPHFSLLPQDQRQQQEAVNATAAPISSELLHTLFLKQVEGRATEPAVITPTMTLTYQELYERANQVGHWLRQHGAEPNQLVAVVMAKGWEQVVAVLGIHLSGAAYLPIDPNLPTERRHFLLEEGEVSLALTQNGLDNDLTWPAEITRLAVDTLPLDATLAPLEMLQDPTDLAYVIYTSGSTGRPKGVVIDHRGAVNTVLDVNQRYGVTAKDRVLALSALNFDLSVYDIFGLLAAGGAIVIPDVDRRIDPDHWQELIQHHGVTVWNTVPALMQMLVEYEEGQSDRVAKGQVANGSSNHNLQLATCKPATLRLVMMSGDWIPVTLPDRIRALWTGAKVYSLGGATEASIWSIEYPIEEVDPAWASIPYGKPMTNQTFHVFDANLNPRPTWVPGDLYIGGIGLALGYWKDEERTNASFIIDPRTGARLYKTGDLGRYLPNGNPSASSGPCIEFLGREDFQVKIRGHRIELGEIESALLQHPGISEAVVTAIGDPSGHRQLVSYVVPNEKDPTLFQEITEDDAYLDKRWQAITHVGNLQAEQVIPNLDVVSFQDSATELEQTSYLAICHTLHQFDLFSQPGEQYNLAQLIDMCTIKPTYTKLFLQWLEVLCEEDVLQKIATDTWQVQQVMPAVAWAQIENRLTELGNRSSQPWVKTLIDYSRNSMAHHVALLRGEVNPLELFFADGQVEQAETLYQFNPMADVYNRMAAEILSAFAAHRSPNEPLNILEIGAGVGSATASLLPILPAEQTTYTYTDLSLFFLEQAKEKFSAYPYVRYDLFDIDQEPRSQGYELHTYDVIVASNVLHDARNVHTSLQYLHSLLAPGGILLAIEATTDSRWQKTTVRFIEGFSHYEDERLQLNSPLLNVEQWVAVLQQNGYPQQEGFTFAHVPSAVANMHVLVAQTPSRVQNFSPEYLRSYLSKKLPDYMIPANYIALETLPLTANGKIDRNALPHPKIIRQQHTHIVAPRTPTEETLAAIWQDALNLEQLSVHDDFFAIGGDSLIATRIISQIREAFSINIQLTYLYEAPTIAQFAEMISFAIPEVSQASGEDANLREEMRF